MKKLKKNLVITLLLFWVVSSIFAQNSTEIVIGSVSGTQNAGEVYDLYQSSADSFREYFAGWQSLGVKDYRVDYSYNQLYDICLDEAKRQYGRDYPNLYMKNFYYNIDEIELPDEESYSQVVGSSTKYRKKERRKRIYNYSATVVVYQ